MHDGDDGVERGGLADLARRHREQIADEGALQFLLAVRAFAQQQNPARRRDHVDDADERLLRYARVAIIEKVKLIYAGPVQGVRDQMSSGRVVWVRVASDTEQALALIKARPEVAEVASLDHKLKITLTSHDIDHSILAEVLVRGGAKLTELREDELGLEEVFLRVTRGETQ